MAMRAQPAVYDVENLLHFFSTNPFSIWDSERNCPEFEQIFDELEAEYEQCVLDNKNLTIEKKNLLIKNDCLIAECLEKDICSIVLSSDIVVPPSSNCLCEDLRSACDREHTKVLELKAEVNESQVTGKTSSGPSTSETPKVLAPGMYNLGSKYIPPPKRANGCQTTSLLEEASNFSREPPDLTQTNHKPVRVILRSKLSFSVCVPMSTGGKVKPLLEPAKTVPKKALDHSSMRLACECKESRSPHRTLI
ncbi:hypothetical protein Tco_0093161 [Tanacetum coccineum]